MNTSCLPSGLKLGDVVSNPVRPTNGFGDRVVAARAGENKLGGRISAARPDDVLPILGVDRSDVEPATRRRREASSSSCARSNCAIRVPTIVARPRRRCIAPDGCHAGESAAPTVGIVRSFAPSLSMILSVLTVDVGDSASRRFRGVP